MFLRSIVRPEQQLSVDCAQVILASACTALSFRNTFLSIFGTTVIGCVVWPTIVDCNYARLFSAQTVSLFSCSSSLLQNRVSPLEKIIGNGILSHAKIAGIIGFVMAVLSTSPLLPYPAIPFLLFNNFCLAFLVARVLAHCLYYMVYDLQCDPLTNEENRQGVFSIEKCKNRRVFFDICTVVSIMTSVVISRCYMRIAILRELQI